MEKSLKELAGLIGGELTGDESHTLRGVSSLAAADASQIVYVESPRYFPDLANCKAGLLLISPPHYHEVLKKNLIDDRQNCLLVGNPHGAFARISQIFNPLPELTPGVHGTAMIGSGASIPLSSQIGPKAVIESDVVVGEGVFIGAGVWLGSGSSIGDNTRIHANVSVYPGTIIGDDCLIHAGAVIGSEGFGHARENEKWIRLPQTGKVRIGNNVRIGANTTVDCGSLEDTVIGNGVKLDNGIQIGHNVKIGCDTAIAAHSAIGGSSEIGQRCALGGLVGFGAHTRLTDDVFITAMSGVNSDIREAGAYSSTMQVMPVADWNRNFARFRQLDKLAKQVRSIASSIKKQGKEHE